VSRWSLRTRLVVATVVAVAVGFVAGATLVAVLASVEDAPGETRRAARADGDRDALQTIARRRVVVGGSVAAATAGAVGWMLVGATLAPLERLRAGAAEVAATTDLTRRVPVGGGPDEVDVLGHTINEMLARLQAAEAASRAALDASRAFAGGAAHELRTPLTSIQVDLETLGNPALDEDERRAIVGQMHAEHARLVALLDQLLALARGDLGRRESEGVDVGDLVEVAVHDATRRAADAALAVEADDDLVVQGSSEGLRLAVDNLVENALRHGRGPVEVSATSTGEAPGWIVVRVDDHGPGIPAEDRPRIVGRFERGRATTTPGSGLGLALVDQQAQLHGGRLTLDERPGGGLRAELWLPRSR
jgi:two-component system sensor histidine kinase PrrB